MSKNQDPVLKFAQAVSSTGLAWPEYEQPKWWQWRKRAYIRWMDKHNLKYKLVDSKVKP